MLGHEVPDPTVKIAMVVAGYGNINGPSGK